MSTIKLQGNASGTGTFTFAAPNTNTNRTITIPDEDITLGGVDGITSSYTSGTAVNIDSSANLQFNSGYGSVATAYGCRAWVNFNGTGTVAIRESGNVSSITDNSTGNYTVNFTTAMPDANYCVSATGSDAGGNRINGVYNYTTSSIIVGAQTTSAVDDVEFYNVAIFR